MEIDKSRKNSVDADIANLINIINNGSCGNYITTSSCSGRIVIYQKNPHQKQNCKWIKVSHENIDNEEIIELLKDLESETYMKFEPFILHCVAKTSTLAQKLLQIGISSGFRESGISLGKKKIMVAIRSSNNMDIPIADEFGNLMVSPEYIAHICSKFNTKMSENSKRRDKFEDEVIKLLKDIDNIIIK